MSRTLYLTEQLISRASLTPDDAGCQDIIAARLAPLGFVCETIASGPDHFRVTNLWAKRAAASAVPAGVATELIVFAGHTDVVPTGPLAQWHSDPFTPTHRDGKLYGRGASDMKTSLAAFVVAVEEFVTAQPDTALSIGFLLTSDEEGPATDGTVIVCEALQARGEKLDYCIVGEPTSLEHTGDMIKNGRRGTMSGKLTVKGVQGHIAYPHLAKNPIHLVAPALAELVGIEWDRGNDFFPPTSWQVSNIHGGTGASNVIPGAVVIDFNFRFCTESNPEALQTRLQAVLQQHGLDFDLTWTVGGLPFLTTPGTLVDAVCAAIKAETGIDTVLSTTGGTSDGRFIAKICPQVIEVGPPNATIHKIDEHLHVADIEPLKNIYRRVLENLSTRLTT
ncbi:MAG: succinyl-diaminopimelate desuccinylase [Rhodoferax sp.]|uniref:succinyl-diaminopimelate desuccinylase n=1 Tax=Rhodoferax sp. TaxID=50421 RepID=UPI0017CE33CE|nr:succinyl-diaminopimelate desuccinylase [Rhodoferax sp.]NMM15335.1 succinyl-diaminopimelate desuccinylase [Rhodoferax sp.]NMM21049.1 succinyl-diaminopimelate desuccinylase [Rhodoferax sp.]